MSTKDHSPRDLVTDYLDNKKNGYVATTVSSHESVLSKYAKFLETSDIGPLEVEPEDMRNFIRFLVQERGLVQSTLRKYASVLKSFYIYLERDSTYGNLSTPTHELDSYVRSIIEMATVETNSRPDRENLNSYEFARLYQTATTHSPRHEFTIFLLGHTGLLANEAANFTPEWLDRDHSIISVPREQDGWQPKSCHRIRDIPLHRYAKKTLESQVENLPTDAFQVSPRTIHRRVNTLGTSSGIPGVNPSLLRRTFGNRLMRTDIPMDVARGILGLRQKNDSFRRFETRTTGKPSIDLNDFPPLYPELIDSDDGPIGGDELR